jgi:hypothetical protein
MNVLENRIKELEHQVERLTERCDELQDMLHTMALAKLADPRYPYWNWLLINRISDEVRMPLTMLLGALNDRVISLELPDELKKKGIDGVPQEVLYGPGAPTREEAYAAIKTVIGMKYDDRVTEMLQAIKEQGILQSLCDHLLPGPAVCPPGPAGSES